MQLKGSFCLTGDIMLEMLTAENQLHATGKPTLCLKAIFTCFIKTFMWCVLPRQYASRIRPNLKATAGTCISDLGEKGG